MIPINITTVGLLLISTICLLIYRIFRVPRRLRGLPRVPLLETLKDLAQGRPFDEAAERYRDIMEKHHIAAHFSGECWHVSVSSVEAAEKIYKDTKMFPKSIPKDMVPDSVISLFMGTNVVFSNHDVWKRHRQVVNPLFKKVFEPSIFGDMTNNLFIALNEAGNTNVRIDSIFQRLTMDVLGKAVLGLNFESLLNQDVPFINYYNTIMKSFSPFTVLFPSLESPKNPLRKPAFDAVSNLEQHFEEILEERRGQLDNVSNKRETMDLLTAMLLANEDGFTDRDIRDNIMIFLVAGQDTTTLSLCAALYLLAKHPEYQQRLFDEINDTVGRDPENPIVPTHEQLKEMPYLAAFIKETMRLYPAVSQLPVRVNSEDVELEGHIIPRGTRILVETYLLHRDPKYWKDPDSFNPNRFLDTKQNNGAWYAFGGGSRFCLGMNFSLLEQKVVLTMLLQKYQVTTEADHFPLLPNFVLTPDDLRMNFVSRI